MIAQFGEAVVKGTAPVRTVAPKQTASWIVRQPALWGERPFEISDSPAWNVIQLSVFRVRYSARSCNPQLQQGASQQSPLAGAAGYNAASSCTVRNLAATKSSCRFFAILIGPRASVEPRPMCGSGRRGAPAAPHDDQNVFSDACKQTHCLGLSVASRGRCVGGRARANAAGYLAQNVADTDPAWQCALNCLRAPPHSGVRPGWLFAFHQPASVSRISRHAGQHHSAP